MEGKRVDGRQVQDPAHSPGSGPRGLPDHVLAVDIGATKMAVGLVAVDGRILQQASVPTGRERARDAILTDLRHAIDGVRSGTELACGVGTAGPFDPETRVLATTSIPALRGLDLADHLERSLGLPTHVANDGQAFALGEQWLGAAQGASDFVGLVVSTGIGGGIVCDGHLLRGAAGNAGHLGHVIVQPDGLECQCGGRGCVESEASGWAIARLSGGAPKDAPWRYAERSASCVGILLASLFNLLDLRLAVIGGSVALGYGPPYLELVRQTAIREARLPHARTAQIQFARLGPDAPLIGAARVALIQLP